MKILALEFSSRKRSVVVGELKPGLPAEILGAAEQETGLATQPLDLIERALAFGGVSRAEIRQIVIGLGPGSYTGIRLAISIAQGWQLATPVGLIGCSSADCIAEEAQLRGGRGKLTVAIDAQRGEYYAARYDVDDEQPILVEPLRLATRTEIESRVANGETIVGPDFHVAFPSVIQTFLTPDIFPHAARLLRRLAIDQREVAGNDLEPIYLRETTFVKAPAARPVKPFNS